jgi:hypothetical protein
VYHLGPAGPERYFAADQFWFDESPHPRRGKVTTIAGAGGSEGMGPPTAEFVSAGTYDPIIAFRFEELARVDTVASEALIRKQFGGFAGLHSRSDILGVERADGSKALWDERARRVVP